MHTESNMKFLSNSFLGVKNDDAEIWIFFFFFSKVGKMHFLYIWVFAEHAFGFKENWLSGQKM